ncbi:MAG: hypothetical protein RLZ81_361 [Pseudomonadota bacterium]|jgi:uncharacterized surface protein with fasciclin (FAS1) repeats
MIHWLKKVAALSVVALVAACGGSDDPHPINIVETAQSDARFSILVEAVVAADLASTLSGPGPFTVLAPTNDAFAALLTELGLTKQQLLADKALLTSVLTYHVLAGKVNKADVPIGKAIKTLQGGIFKIDAVGAALRVTDGRNRNATIILTDLATSNGVIHAIDRVLLPANKNVVQTAAALSDFSILVEAVTAADLGSTLSGAGPFTVFAPTNAAFAALLTELGLSKSALLADKALLTKVLTYHVLGAQVLKAEVPIGTPIKTLQGDTFTISAALAIADQRGRNATIVGTDVLTSNGVIHVLDRVILPSP